MAISILIDHYQFLYEIDDDIIHVYKYAIHVDDIINVSKLQMPAKASLMVSACIWLGKNNLGVLSTRLLDSFPDDDYED